MKLGVSIPTDMYLCVSKWAEKGWDRGVTEQHRVGHCRCESVSVSLTGHQSLPSDSSICEADRSSRMVTSAGHYRARTQPIASAINDKGWAKSGREAEGGTVGKDAG